MKQYTPDRIRNIALAGHSNAGKTTLAEAMLYHAGAIDRLGKTSEGNTCMDFDPEEVKRKVDVYKRQAIYCPIWGQPDRLQK